ncbi:hypothetical protein [Allosphingosinicella flava]|nr:hypothetical protein [Sphingosinicella flava]
MGYAKLFLSLKYQLLIVPQPLFPRSYVAYNRTATRILKTLGGL